MSTQLSPCALFCKLSSPAFRSLEEGAEDGDCPVGMRWPGYSQRANESRSLEVERKRGGNLHPRKNTVTRPIVDKYREGKMKSTPRGELKDLKLTKRKQLYMIHDALTVITDAECLVALGESWWWSCARSVCVFRAAWRCLGSVTDCELSSQSTGCAAIKLPTDMRRAQLTRLETRTKELNLCASEREKHPVAKRKQLL